MQSALQTTAARHDVDLKIVDIDTDPQLVALYDELVPVLVECTTTGEIIEICHHFLDRQALQRLLPGSPDTLTPNEK